MSSHQLTTSIQFAKGVGPRRKGLFARMGIMTIRDALFFFPRKYEDRRTVQRIVDLQPTEQPVTVYGRVLTSAVIALRNNKTLFTLSITDGSGTFIAKWFNQPYLKSQFAPDQQVALTGKIAEGRREMIHPEYDIVDMRNPGASQVHTGRIVPIYSLTEGFSQETMRSIMDGLLDIYIPKVPETLPATIREKHQLLSLQEALRRLHRPLPHDDVKQLQEYTSPAHHRVIFDELFFLEIGLSIRWHQDSLALAGHGLNFFGELEAQLRNNLPFSFTNAQQRAITEIQKDLRDAKPMNRLLQGDVGSGKTLVALIALLSVIEAGSQGVLLVPTSLLAEQHYQKIKTYCASLRHAGCPLRVAVFTGSMSKRERDHRLKKLAAGEIDLVVGTHALLQTDVTFHRLGLGVIDEQHKFGVRQRARIGAKGQNPNMLIMTATPIPRTLSLTTHGDLDISVINELPPGRTPVVTRHYYEQNRHKAYQCMREQIKQGRQVYIIYPLVEESEKLDLKAATEMSQHLAQEVFPQYRIGLVHGSLKQQEKEVQMQLFQQHKLDILVSTTVLEVGIDVANATVMCIEHAERFGLSQLHQLRGRVGRGEHRSYCLLLTDYAISEDAQQRLAAMVETTDGFILSERDLEIRGPGEFFGTKQSGMPSFRLADPIRDIATLETARAEALQVVADDPELSQCQHTPLREALQDVWQERIALLHIG